MVDYRDLQSQGSDFLSAPPTMGTGVTSPFRSGMTPMESSYLDVMMRDQEVDVMSREAMLKSVSFGDLVKYNFQNRNTLSNMFEYAERVSDGFEKNNNPKFDRLKAITEMGFTDDEIGFFDGLESESAVRRRADNIRNRRFREEVIQANGLEGILASFPSEIADISNLYIGFRGVKFAKAGESLTRIGARTGVEGLVAETGIQAFIQLNDPDRTGAQSAVEISAGGLGAAFLGTGAAAFARSIGSSKEAVGEAILKYAGEDTPTYPTTLGGRDTKSVNAMQAMPQGELVKIAATNPVFNTLQKFSGGLTPNLRNLSPEAAPELAQLHAGIVDNSFMSEGARIKPDGSFEASAESAEIRQQVISRKAAKQQEDILRNSYLEYIGVGDGDGLAKKVTKSVGAFFGKDGAMSMNEYYTLIGKANARQDSATALTRIDGTPLTGHEVKMISKHAQEQRRLMDELREMANQAGFELPENNDLAASYATRVFNQRKISARTLDSNVTDGGPSWASSLDNWARQQWDSEIEELKRIQREGDYTNLSKSQVEDEITFFSNKSNFRQFRDDLALDTKESISGRHGIGFGTIKKARARGVFKEVTLTADTLDVEDFLVQDISQTMPKVIRVMSGEIAFMEKYGTTNFDDLFDMNMARKTVNSPNGTNPKLKVEPIDIKQVKAEHQMSVSKGIDEKIAKETDPAKKKKLEAKKEDLLVKADRDIDRSVADMRQLWDMVRGNYRASTLDPEGVPAKLLQSTRLLTMTAFLGGVVLSSIPDTAMIVLANGLAPTMKHGMKPLVKSLVNKDTMKALRSAKKELNHLSVALDAVGSHRLVVAAEVDSLNSGNTAWDRFLESASNIHGNASLINQWTDSMQTVAGYVEQQNIIDFAVKGNITQKEATYLSKRGINSTMRKRIAEEAQKHMYEQGGIRVPNVQSWDEEVAKAFGSALFRGSRQTILMKSLGDVPLFFNDEIGKTMFQFMTHPMVSHSRVLMSSIQTPDKQALVGLSTLAFMGAMSYYLKEVRGGREPSSDWKVWIAEGLNRSSIPALPFMLNDTILEPAGLGLSNLIDDEDYNKYNKMPKAPGFAAAGYLKKASEASGMFGNLMRGEAPTEQQFNAGRTITPLNKVPGIGEGLDLLNKELYGE